MAKTLAEVVETTSATQAEIVAWVHAAWVLPAGDETRWYFDAADEARVALIAQLRHDMGIDDEAMPVVLRLLDQLYSLHHMMSEVHRAFLDLPAEHQEALSTRLYRVRYGYDPFSHE